MISKQLSIRGLLGITALLAGSFAAYRYAPMGGLLYYWIVCYLALPSIVAMIGRLRVSGDARDSVLTAINLAVVSLILIGCVGGEVALLLAIVAQMFFWPPQYLFFVYQQHRKLKNAVQ